MISSTPIVSIIMTVYNGSPYLEESVKSVLIQSFNDFEFIIIDDCSTDNSWDLLSNYAISDRRIRLLRNRQNMGLTKSLNRGLHLAQGKYIARQDADDVSLPTRFEKQIAWLESHPETVLISSEIQRIKPNGNFGKVTARACPADFLPWHLIFHNHLGGHSQVMFHRQPVLDLGGYNEAYRYSQDYELWCRLAQVGKLAVLPEALLNQRFHTGSISANKQSEQNALVLKQVTYNIEQLTGKTPPLSTVENLHRLWSTDQDSKAHRFPESGLAHYLSNWLDTIYKAYISQPDLTAPPLFKQALRGLIGQKFLTWANTLSLRKQLLIKIQLYLLALRWAPQQTLKPRSTPTMTMSALWETANG
ncbi:MAG: glycosyltransferase [Cyanobacteria bacterium J06635_15]